jgi:hypothetical protein
VAQSWRGRPTLWVWDGRDANGRQLPDGTYAYQLSSIDAADNQTIVELRGIRVDTRAAVATLEALGPGVSPNGDGVADALVFATAARPADGIRSWRLAIVDDRRSLVKVFGGDGLRGVPAQIVWDGRDDTGKVTEGSFQAELVVEYERGTVARGALAGPVVVDVNGPRVSVTSQPALFSPDGDGENETLAIAVSARGRAAVAEWSVQIMDPLGNPFARLAGSGAPPAAVSWDGRSASGERARLMPPKWTHAAPASQPVGSAAGSKYFHFNSPYVPARPPCVPMTSHRGSG